MIEPFEGSSQLPAEQKRVAIGIALAMLAVVLELVRRRKLREEYSLLWIATAGALMALALEPRLLDLFTQSIGAKTAPSALFFGALLFLMLVSLLVSIRLSRLTFRSKQLAQQVALQRREVEELAEEIARLRREAGGAEPPQRDADQDLLVPRTPRVAKDGAA